MRAPGKELPRELAGQSIRAARMEKQDLVDSKVALRAESVSSFRLQLDAAGKPHGPLLRRT